VSAGALLGATLVVTVGSALQGAVGFGLGMLAAPLLLLVDPRLVPGPLLVAALFLTVLITTRERAAIDFHGLGWALVGRAPGTLLGAAAIALASPRGVRFLVALMVLVAVGLVGSGLQIARTRGSLFGAGVLSGVLSTTSSIGGPAIAILYQDDPGGRVRGTLSSFFTVGLVFSILALAVLGEFGRAQVEASVVLLPGVLLGFLLSRSIARVLDRGHTRTAILVLSTLAALGVLLQALLAP
jgi:uncharacterized membrane protein YfcA